MFSHESYGSLRYLSVCDGIGAVHLAWQQFGWECVGISEIAPFPAALVAFVQFGGEAKTDSRAVSDVGEIVCLEEPDQNPSDDDTTRSEMRIAE